MQRYGRDKVLLFFVAVGKDDGVKRTRSLTDGSGHVTNNELKELVQFRLELPATYATFALKDV